jgi:hypothetical protein
LKAILFVAASLPISLSLSLSRVPPYFFFGAFELQRYDPRYGVGDRAFAMAPEQRSALEDLVATSPLGPLLRVVALRRNDDLEATVDTREAATTAVPPAPPEEVD